MLDSNELNKKYVGKEVIYHEDKKGFISRLTGYRIEIKSLTGACWVFDTGTGAKDNAVANGYIRFVDEALKEEFIDDYEQYVHSFEGETEAFDYRARIYD